MESSRARNGKCRIYIIKPGVVPLAHAARGCVTPVATAPIGQEFLNHLDDPSLIPWGDKGRRRQGEEPPLRPALFRAAPRKVLCSAPKEQRARNFTKHSLPTCFSKKKVKKAPVNVYSNKAFCLLRVLKKKLLVTSCVFEKLLHLLQKSKLHRRSLNL